MASSQQSYFIPQQQQYTNYTPSSPQDQTFNFNTKVSPSILLIIVILAIIFFVSGLLHLLVRFLLRPPSRPDRRDAADLEGVTALQGQLQQLFHLHDAGVDQSFIDTLPVFHYKSIIGLKNPFDCAVCLCEFEADDKLRLLPKCSHAFHTECIDTWLLSHSTCPLCRASLLFQPTADCSAQSAYNASGHANTTLNCSPIVLVLESASSDEASREMEQQVNVIHEEPTSNDNANNSSNNLAPLDSGNEKEKVVMVKLGKFRNVDNGCGGEGTSGGAGSSSNHIGVDSRRCFSMGSFAYVMDESSNLRVPIRTPLKKSKNSSDKKMRNLGTNPGFLHRAAISECDCESKRDFEFNEISKPESFPVPKNDCKGEIVGCSIDCSRRAFSFRFQRNYNNAHGNGGGCGDEMKGKNGKFPRRTVSEIGVARWESEGNNNINIGEESDRSMNSLDSQLNPPSFARKTLLWLMGRQQQQNKVVHSPFDPPNNV